MKARILAFACSMATWAMGGDFLGQGYFRAMAGTDTVPKYLRIRGDSGFYCILDDKSSFRFRIIGDSMTTPMNGKDRINYAPGSGSVQISGEEKGEPYFTIFAPLQAGQYPAPCVEEEAKLYGPVTVGPARPGPERKSAGQGRVVDPLGRKQTAVRPVWTWRLRQGGQ